MKAVISVTGCDAVGIIAKVSAVCAEYEVNIVDISQTVLQEYFSMIMLVEIDRINAPFTAFVDRMSELGKQNRLEIHTMHEDIFNAMHRI
ncbi:MAG: ACT domain-containing protein [Lentisphaerae bacterium]|nr:ACT domain-containing protein [Lentisphaerota bacterium]